MTMISVVSASSVPATQSADHSAWAITLFCCVGLTISLCLMATGIDLGSAWV